MWIAGKYHLKRLIGFDGTASVYEAANVNGNRVRIRVLDRHVASQSGNRERFLWESYFANLIDHSGVERVLNDGVTEDQLPFLVMEAPRSSRWPDALAMHAALARAYSAAFGATLPAVGPRDAALTRPRWLSTPPT